MKPENLRDFAGQAGIDLWLTCSSGSIFDALHGMAGCIVSEYIDDVPSGAHKGALLCQDIQRTSFPDDCFDLIVTEDVMEHVPNPKQAFAEIRRVLKPGGHHVSTIPVNWSRHKSATRAVIANGDVVHFMEPEYHGDPTRPDRGILAFSDYGTDLIDEFLSITGQSWMLAAHGDKQMEDEFGIYDSWVFVSRKALRSS